MRQCAFVSFSVSFRLLCHILAVSEIYIYIYIYTYLFIFIYVGMFVFSFSVSFFVFCSLCWLAACLLDLLVASFGLWLAKCFALAANYALISCGWIGRLADG